MQSTYFHFSAECARRLVPRFEMTHVIVHNEIKEQLKEGHKEILDQHNIKYLHFLQLCVGRHTLILAFRLTVCLSVCLSIQ